MDTHRGRALCPYTDDCTYATPDEPEAYGNRVYQFNAVEGDIKLPKQHHLSEDRNKSY